MKLSLLLAYLSAASGALTVRKPSSLNNENATEVVLSNGALLALDITEPTSKAVFETNNFTEVKVEGYASVELGQPDVAYIYVIDTSGSTLDDDGDCGTILECIQAFVQALHAEALSDGSARLAGVINFDTIATVSAPLQSVNMTTAIDEAIMEGFSSGDTECQLALEAAAQLVKDPLNTARTTVVVFVGDGYCTDSPDPSVLGDTGAIVHTVAVGDNVNCTAFDDMYFNNSLIDIPQNGGKCTSVPDPNTLPNIVDDLIGSDLFSLEFMADGAEYVEIPNANFLDGKRLPAPAPAKIDFELALDFFPGEHEICIRATGDDSFGAVDVVQNCRQFTIVEAQPEPVVEAMTRRSESPSPTLTIVLSFVGTLAVLLVVFAAVVCCRNKTSSPATINNTRPVV